jgi:flagellar motor protein MotB
MNTHTLAGMIVLLLLTGCTTVQRGSLAGALVGSGAGAGIGAAGGAVGVAIGASAGAGAGALLGGAAGEMYEVNRMRVKEEKATFNDQTGEAYVRTKTLAATEKQLALAEARARELLAQNQRMAGMRPPDTLIAPQFAPQPGMDSRLVQVETSAEGLLQVSMVSEVLFEPGSAKIKEAVYPVLDEIGGTIGREYPEYYVAIEGHTDAGEAAVAAQYRSEWELSAARALAVLHYFDDQKLINQSQMAIAGYGPYRSGSVGADPGLNRRVVITLMPQKAPVAGY